MGIDIYAKWANQSEEEHKAQITGFSIEAGHVGYLREAYHGDIYATRVLVPEAFDADEGEAPIPAATLRQRLPATLKAARERARETYHASEEEMAVSIKSFEDFVTLCEDKERQTGKPVTIIASY